MSSELPVGPENLRAERDRLEGLLHASEDWRALVQLKARQKRGEALSEVSSDRLELMLRSSLTENPAYGRYMSVCASIDRGVDAKSSSAAASAGVAGQPAADDLTRIRGVDAALAKRLRAMDIVAFEQIANWRSPDVQNVSDVLDLGRLINSQNWIEQAAMLMPPSARIKPQVPPTTLSKPAIPSVPLQFTTVHQNVSGPSVESLADQHDQADLFDQNLMPPKPPVPPATRADPVERPNIVAVTPTAPSVASSPTTAAQPNTPQVWQKLIPPKPFVVMRSSLPAPVQAQPVPAKPVLEPVRQAPSVPPPYVSAVPSGQPQPLKAVVVPPPLPRSSPSTPEKPTEAVAWALDRALEAIRNSKQVTTPAAAAASVVDTATQLKTPLSLSVATPVPVNSAINGTSANGIARPGPTPPPLPPPAVSEAVLSATSAAIIMPRSARGDFNGRLEREELAASRLVVEEASVEIVRRPPSSNGLTVPPAPPPPLVAEIVADGLAETTKPEGRGAKPLGRFLKALTGN